MSNEVEDYDEEEVEVAVAPACIASEGYALTVADNTWAGNFGGRGITMTQVFLKPGNEQELSTSQLMVNQVRQVWAENQTEMLRTPKLITELVNQTKLFETMTNNWDREGAIAPTTDAINQLGMFFQKVFNYISFELAVPGISASKNGGIYLFWDDENVNIEVKIPPTIGEDIEVFIQNPSKGFIYDGKLHPEIEQRIYELVSKMKISLELPIARVDFGRGDFHDQFVPVSVSRQKLRELIMEYCGDVFKKHVLEDFIDAIMVVGLSNTPKSEEK